MPVLVVQTANLRDADDLANLRNQDGPGLEALLVRREMGSCPGVVGEAGMEHGKALRRVAKGVLAGMRLFSGALYGIAPAGAEMR